MTPRGDIPLVEVVTTFNRFGFKAYGKRFLQTFSTHWHGSVLLSVYNEGSAGEFIHGQRLRILSYEHRCPAGVDFKNREHPDPPDVAANRYRFDVCRFSHKIFSLAEAARRTKADYLLLIDADVETHGYVDPFWLAGLLQDADDSFHVACLLRPWYHHTECSFVLYRMCPKTRDMIDTMEAAYTEGFVYSLPGWCDSSVFDHVRQRFEAERGLKTKNLTQGQPADMLTVFEPSVLGTKMVHNKGRRKFKAAKPKPSGLHVPPKPKLVM